MNPIMLLRLIIRFSCLMARHLSRQIQLRKGLATSGLCMLLIIVITLMRGEKQYVEYDGPCPEIVWALDSQGLSAEDGYYYDPLKVLQCKKIIDGDSVELQRAESFAGCTLLYDTADSEYLGLLPDCDNYKKFQYTDFVQTEEEENFGIAFSILMYENVFQVERLLQTIYRPQNSYCIHIDAKAKAETYNAMASIANCFDNVILTSERINVVYGLFPILEAEMSCLKALQKFRRWKYFINLTGREFPIRTNWELVQILKAYNGSNDVLGYHKGRPWSWTAVKWWAYQLPSPIMKSAPPHNFKIAKGSTHIAVTREFVEFVLHDQRAIDLYEWMRDIRVPDEQYFNTLSHNPDLNIPGAYKGLPDEKGFLVRYKLWRQFHDICHGPFIHGICIFGVRDLYNLTQSPRMFANKFRTDIDSVAYTCMEMWVHNRTMNGPNTNFDVSFYAQQPWVKNHVHVSPKAD